MTIDWSAFTPWSALAGGVLIGIAAAMFALLNGRVAGISGVVGGLLRPARGDVGWQAAFVLGCPVGTVKTHVHRAKQKLKVALASWAPER